MRWALAVAVLLACVSNAAAALGKLNVVYFSNWASGRPASCALTPSDFPATKATHMLYAFAFLNDDFSIRLLQANDPALLAQAVALKAKNRALKVLISIGGWTMNMPGSSTYRLFSSMARTNATRAAFIKSALAFTLKYKLDGVDLDWEYPGVTDRGGASTDAAGLTALAWEFKAAAKRAGRSQLLTLAVAGASDGWKALQLAKLAPHVDFFSVMAFDMRGAWEPKLNYHAPWANAGGGGDSAAVAAAHYVAGGVPKSKISLSLAAYGRSWQLASTGSATAVGSAAMGPGTAGRCTRDAGFLSWREIKDLIASGATVKEDLKVARSAYLVKSRQWVSFDTPSALYAKIQAADALGLGGLTLWAADLDDASWTMTTLMASRTRPASPPPAPARPPPPRPPPPTGPPCGGGAVGSGACPNATLCCSIHGYCGVGDAYCAAENCEGGPCAASLRAAKGAGGRRAVAGQAAATPSASASASAPAGTASLAPGTSLDKARAALGFPLHTGG